MGTSKFLRELVLVLLIFHVSASGIPPKDEEFIRKSDSWFPKDKEVHGFFTIEGKEDGNDEALIIDQREPQLTDRQYRVLKQSKTNPATYTEHTVYVRQFKGQTEAEWDPLLSPETNEADGNFAEVFAPMLFTYKRCDFQSKTPYMAVYDYYSKNCSVPNPYQDCCQNVPGEIRWKGDGGSRRKRLTNSFSYNSPQDKEFEIQRQGREVDNGIDEFKRNDLQDDRKKRFDLGSITKSVGGIAGKHETKKGESHIQSTTEVPATESPTTEESNQRRRREEDDEDTPEERLKRFDMGSFSKHFSGFEAKHKKEKEDEKDKTEQPKSKKKGKKKESSEEKSKESKKRSKKKPKKGEKKSGNSSKDSSEENVKPNNFKGSKKNPNEEEQEESAEKDEFKSTTEVASTESPTEESTTEASDQRRRREEGEEGTPEERKKRFDLGGITKSVGGIAGKHETKKGESRIQSTTEVPATDSPTTEASDQRRRREEGEEGTPEERKKRFDLGGITKSVGGIAGKHETKKGESHIQSTTEVPATDSPTTEESDQRRRREEGEEGTPEERKKRFDLGGITKSVGGIAGKHETKKGESHNQSTTEVPATESTTTEESNQRRRREEDDEDTPEERLKRFDMGSFSKYFSGFGGKHETGKESENETIKKPKSKKKKKNKKKESSEEESKKSTNAANKKSKTAKKKSGNSKEESEENVKPKNSKASKYNPKEEEQEESAEKDKSKSTTEFPSTESSTVEESTTEESDEGRRRKRFGLLGLVGGGDKKTNNAERDEDEEPSKKNSKQKVKTDEDAEKSKQKKIKKPENEDDTETIIRKKVTTTKTSTHGEEAKGSGSKKTTPKEPEPESEESSSVTRKKVTKTTKTTKTGTGKELKQAPETPPQPVTHNTKETSTDSKSNHVDDGDEETVITHKMTKTTKTTTTGGGGSSDASAPKKSPAPPTRTTTTFTEERMTDWTDFNPLEGPPDFKPIGNFYYRVLNLTTAIQFLLQGSKLRNQAQTHDEKSPMLAAEKSTFIYDTDPATGAPVLEDTQSPYTGYYTCPYNKIEIEAVKDPKDPGQLIDFHLSRLRAQCVKDLREKMLRLFDIGLVKVKTGLRVKLDEKHKIFISRTPNRQEWLDGISAFFLHCYSNAYMDELEKLTRQVNDNRGPTGAEISWSVRTLSVMLFKGLDMLDGFGFHAIKLIRFIANAARERFLVSLHTKIHLTEICAKTNCGNLMEINYNNRVQLMGLMQFAIFGVDKAIQEKQRGIEASFNGFFKKNLEFIKRRVSYFSFEIEAT